MTGNLFQIRMTRIRLFGFQDSTSLPTEPVADLQLECKSDVLRAGQPWQRKKVKWIACEDQQLAASIAQYHSNHSSLITGSLPGRTGKQCRERRVNQFSLTINWEGWDPKEDSHLLGQQKTLGNTWA
jgi:myb proto-oncogene protein